MLIRQIMAQLETSVATGLEAQKAARLGFLQWVLSVPDDVRTQTAHKALASLETQNSQSDAAQAFVGYLKDTMQPVRHTPRRHRRSKRRLH